MNAVPQNALPLDLKAAIQMTMAFVGAFHPCGLQAIADHIQEKARVQPITARSATVDAVQELIQRGVLTQNRDALFIPVSRIGVPRR